MQLNQEWTVNSFFSDAEIRKGIPSYLPPEPEQVQIS